MTKEGVTLGDGGDWSAEWHLLFFLADVLRVSPHSDLFQARHRNRVEHEAGSEEEGTGSEKWWTGPVTEKELAFVP